MKPELKAMIDATCGPAGERWRLAVVDLIRDAFLSSLHWRGEELWVGPIYFGRVFLCGRDGESLFAWGLYNHPVKYKETESEARAALEAAAKKKINEWFQEQAK